MAAVSAPTSEHELFERARGLAGQTLGQLAAVALVRVPVSPLRGKGFAGKDSLSPARD